MSCTVLLELKVKPGTGDEVLATLKSILPDTRSYDGNIGLYVIRNQDDPDVLVAVEEWESKALVGALNRRAAPLGPMLEGYRRR